MKAFLASARLELEATPVVEKIVNLNLAPDVMKDLRNPDLDFPITTAVWAKHNAGKVNALVSKLNNSKNRF